MRKMIVAIATLPALVLLASAPALSQKADKIAITPQSQKAAIIIRSPLIQPPPLHKTSYRLTFRVYDPAAEQLKGRSLRRQRGDGAPTGELSERLHRDRREAGHLCRLRL